MKFEVSYHNEGEHFTEIEACNSNRAAEKYAEEMFAVDEGYPMKIGVKSDGKVTTHLVYVEYEATFAAHEVKI